MKKVNEKHIRMISKNGFKEVFWETLKENDMLSHEECYELCEKEYKSVFGQRRYSSFSSFRRRRDE